MPAASRVDSLFELVFPNALARWRKNEIRAKFCHGGYKSRLLPRIAAFHHSFFWRESSWVFVLWIVAQWLEAARDEARRRSVQTVSIENQKNSSFRNGTAKHFFAYLLTTDKLHRL